MTSVHPWILPLLFSWLAISPLQAQDAVDGKVSILDIRCVSKPGEPCKIDVYNADGDKLDPIDAPPIAKNTGLPAIRHGKGFVAVAIDGKTVYLSRGDITVRKSFAAANPGAPPCVAQTGTMGSSCPGAR